MKRSLFIAVCVTAALLLLPMNASAATVTPFTVTTTDTAGSAVPGWPVPGVDDTLMPSGCCQYRDASLARMWSGDIVGTSVVVFSRAADNIWGTETLTTAEGTWTIQVHGKIIPGYGFLGEFVGLRTDGAILKASSDLGVIHGVIVTP